ncbi:MAG: glycosyltransferase family 4 protein [Candidatus Diapherotrites archaeon]
MRIFYLTHTFSLDAEQGGGGEIYSSYLLKELRRQGHEIFVFTVGGKPSKSEKQLGIKVYRAPSIGHHALHKFEYILFTWKAIKLAREFGAEIVHAQNDVLPGLIAHFVKWRLKIPFLLGMEYISENAHSLNLKLVYLLNKLLIPVLNYDFVVSMSEFNVSKYLLKWRVPKNKIKVIPVGIDLREFKPTAPSKELIDKYGSHLIISIKPLYSTNAEGIKYIIRAFKQLVEIYPEYKYLILGEGEKKPELIELVNSLNLQKNVHFLPPKPHSALPEIYSSAEFMVHSFVYEATTSMGLIDSLACGVPLVVTDSGEVKNASQGAAILAKPKDESSIAGAMLKLIESPSLRKELGTNARKIAEEKFSIEKVANDFVSIYKNLTGK